MYLREIEWDGTDWNDLAQGFHNMLGNSLEAERLAASREGLSTVKSLISEWCAVRTGSTRHVGHSLAYCTCPG
jgi:hypothetical protein